MNTGFLIGIWLLDAIENAKENAKINDVQNTEFICGDAEFVLTDLIENKKVETREILK